ncbi:Pex12 amino terminal region-domain-containing protein [Mycena alexandri]|uniref:Pex12 amino terminal region-domain-containing protein n=1 Tax=Mycena alexandri TaxID=1745969 RepID=A0AAD6TFZ5_9AGAR|nr:Pex12 amino terminal region-domain-containing protein [Mycena alexandri]
MESAWESAQTRLAEIRALSWIDGPSLRTIRVGQLDAELLDQELVHLLQEPISKALNSPQWKPELSLFIQLVLYRLSVWNTGATYGAKLQDLRYVVPNPSGPLSPSGLPCRVLLAHGALTVLVPYLHARLRAHALSRAWPDAPSSDRRRKAWDLLVSLESTHSVAALLSFIAFLWDGRFRTVADRLLNMSLIPSRRLVKRDVSYEFMNRQMVWHAFTEFLLFLLPLVSARGIRRRIARITSSISSLLLPPRSNDQKSDPVRGKYWSLPRDQCAICAENASFSLNLAEPTNAFTALTGPSSAHASAPENTTPGSDAEPPLHPINTPYLASCGDVYCYHCLAERMMRAADDDEGQKWECLRCGRRVESADRLVVEIDSGGSEVSGSDYDFSSDMDVTDMSGSILSMGTYSESGLSEG